MKTIRYDSGDEAQFGDFVMYRSTLLWWRWKPGRLSYLPGTSNPHPEMEHDGLSWVGVSGTDGTFRGVLVEPETSKIRRGVTFTRRTDGSSFLMPHQIPEEDW